MDDGGIIALFFQRSEGALEELIRKYGDQLYYQAQRIVHTHEDAEECVNDAAMDVWNSIPPKHPESLLSYVYALVRNRALDRYRYLSAQKRSGDRFAQILDELQESIGPDLEDIYCENTVLTECLQDFLGTLSESDRRLFLERYYLAEDVGKTAEKYGMRENAVSVRLYRMRQRLRVFLEERGVQV